MNYLGEFDAENTREPSAGNARLFRWLESDEHRPGLLAQMRNERPVLAFKSRINAPAFLLSTRENIEHALEHFSSDPYKPVGSGTFVLASDNNAQDRHQEKRDFLAGALRYGEGGASQFIREVHLMAWLACRKAWVATSKSERFDLVTDVAEQAALRFVADWVGIPDRAHVLLQDSMRLGYRATLYQMVARHFVIDGQILETGTGALVKLAGLVGQLMAQASSARPDEQNGDGGRKPLIEHMVAHPDGKSVRELAVNVVGTISGLMSNVPAGVSIAINEMFKDAELLDRAKRAARAGRAAPGSLERAIAGAKALEKFVLEAMRLHPPAAFLPRSAVGDAPSRTLSGIEIPAGADVIVPLGGATRDTQDQPDRFDENRENRDSLIFGHPSRANTSHRCVGEFIAVPLIAHIVRHVLLLPGLSPRVDPETGRPFGLTKEWGYICRSLPMEYDRGGAIRQRPLNVIMRVREPVAEHVAALKKVIRYGAPAIEHLLRGEADPDPRFEPMKIVHFARFVLVNNDTELGLFTTYDGDFDGYIRYFATVAGPLFDQIFAHIEVDAPTPVREHPDEFIDFVRRHDVAPVENYFFSAYPDQTVTDILEAPNEQD